MNILAKTVTSAAKHVKDQTKINAKHVLINITMYMQNQFAFQYAPIINMRMMYQKVVKNAIRTV